MTTWRNLITAEMREQGDNPYFVEAHAPSGTEWLDQEFSDGPGGSRGCEFTLWTHTRVYFPVVHAGSEWVGSVPRAPNDEVTPHQGGE